MWEDYMAYFSGGVLGAEWLWILTIVVGSFIALLIQRRMISEL